MGKQNVIDLGGSSKKMSTEDKALIRAYNERIECGGSLAIGRPKSERKPVNIGLFAPPEEPRLF